MRRLRWLCKSLSLRLLFSGFWRIVLYKHRFYRHNQGSSGLHTLCLQEDESDIQLHWAPGSQKPPPAEELVEATAARLLSGIRSKIREYGWEHPAFYKALSPLPLDEKAPEPVRSMLRAADTAGVGPMAAVAGAIAQGLGQALCERFEFNELIVENGGDIWMRIQAPLDISVYAGLSSLSQRFSLIIEGEKDKPYSCGVACSSGTVGPSLSFGKADAAVVICPDAAGADAWATALGNRIHSPTDLEEAVSGIVNASVRDNSMKALGALVVLADRLAAIGKVKLGPPPLRYSTSSVSISS